MLGEKVDGIDEEIALLHELENIVLEFIHQIELADFDRESDVKLLYEKAKEIKTQIVNVNIPAVCMRLRSVWMATVRVIIG